MCSNGIENWETNDTLPKYFYQEYWVGKTTERNQMFFANVVRFPFTVLYSHTIHDRLPCVLFETCCNRVPVFAYTVRIAFMILCTSRCFGLSQSLLFFFKPTSIRWRDSVVLVLFLFAGLCFLCTTAENQQTNPGPLHGKPRALYAPSKARHNRDPTDEGSSKRGQTCEAAADVSTAQSYWWMNGWIQEWMNAWMKGQDHKKSSLLSCREEFQQQKKIAEVAAKEKEDLERKLREMEEKQNQGLPSLTLKPKLTRLVWTMQIQAINHAATIINKIIILWMQGQKMCLVWTKIPIPSLDTQYPSSKPEGWPLGHASW